MLFLLFVATFYTVLAPCQAVYPGFAYARLSAKIIFLDMELVKDAMRKLESVEYFKNFYRTSHPYQVARAIHDIRYKFRRMVKVYQVAFENIPQETHNEHTPRLLEVQQLNLAIDHLVDTLVEGEAAYDKVLQKRLKKLEKARNETRLKKEKKNSSLRVGKPSWSYKSYDSWYDALPAEFRTPLPVNLGRNRGKPRRGSIKRAIKNFDVNY